METQAVVPLTLAIAENGSGPTAGGYLWCSELTFDEETGKPGFQEESPGAKWTILPFRCPQGPTLIFT